MQQKLNEHIFGFGGSAVRPSDEKSVGFCFEKKNSKTRACSKHFTLRLKASTYQQMRFKTLAT